MEADKVAAYKKLTLVATIPLMEARDASGLKKMKAEFDRMIKGTEPELKDLTGKAKNWQWWLNLMQSIPMLMFGTGVLTLCILAAVRVLCV